MSDFIAAARFGAILNDLEKRLTEKTGVKSGRRDVYREYFPDRHHVSINRWLDVDRLRYGKTILQQITTALRPHGYNVPAYLTDRDAPMLLKDVVKKEIARKPITNEQFEELMDSLDSLKNVPLLIEALESLIDAITENGQLKQKISELEKALQKTEE